MQEELDYLEETIPKQSDEELVGILAINAESYSQLAVDFAVEELSARGFKIEQTDHGFEVITPTGSELNLPRKIRTSGNAKESSAYPGQAGAAHGHELEGVGGWLGLLIFELVILKPLAFLVVAHTFGLGVGVISYYPVLGWLTVLDRLSGVVIAGVAIHAGLKLYRRRPDAVRFTKKFLIVSAACVTALSSLIYMAATDTGVPVIKEDAGNIPAWVIAAWISYAVWYLYLSYSRRVAATYGQTVEPEA